MDKQTQIVLLSGLLFLVIDGIYLYSMRHFFNNLVKRIQGKNINLKVEGVILCYIFLISGLNYFVILNDKLKDDQKIKNAFWLGIIIFGVFETTCFAMFDNWNIKTVMLDTMWGGILFSATTLFTLKFSV